jgi:hypothetical protein
LRTPGGLGAAMDLIYKGIKARRGHRYLRAAFEGCEQRPSRNSAGPAKTANPETGRPVAASSFASVRESPAPLREVAAPGWRRWPSQAAIAWALGYGALRIYWALGTASSQPPAGTDLVAVTGWWPGEFLTYALGVPLRKMSNPAASLARGPAAQEGGPR